MPLLKKSFPENLTSCNVQFIVENNFKSGSADNESNTKLSVYKIYKTAGSSIIWAYDNTKKKKLLVNLYFKIF